MATHDYSLANQSGASFRSDLNNCLSAVLSNNSNATAPSTTVAYMLWADTSNNLIKIRNSANNAWITLFTTAGGLDVDAASNFNEDVTFTGASYNVTWDKSANNLIFNDNAKAIFGTSSDGVEIFHDGSNSFIRDSGTGSLIIRTNDFNVQNADGTETMIWGDDDAAVKLFYNGSAKFETTNSGVKVTGQLTVPQDFVKLDDNVELYLGNGAPSTPDLEIVFDGTHSRIKHVPGTGDLVLQSNDIYLTDGAGSEVYFRGVKDGAVELYYDNSKKLETMTSGVRITDWLLELRAGSGSYAYLRLLGDDGADNNDYFQFSAYDGVSTWGNYGSGSWETNIECNANGNVELYYDNSKKLETTSSGIQMEGDINLRDSQKVQLGTNQDLQIYHDGSNSWAYANWASGYALKIHNDGANTNRYGLGILCGSDDNTGTNFALTFYDGNGTSMGDVTFSGGTVTYGTFTAHHPCIVPDADNPSDSSNAYPYGTLLETISIQYTKDNDGSDTERGIRYKVQKTQSANSKKVLGAYGSSRNGGPDNQTNEHQALVLGDGHILCNNAGGNIQVGDGICSSAAAGIGQKATVNPSMIIGIAQEAVTFTGSEIKLVAVQYGLQQFIPWA